eukprot:TRINITY_DN2123_c0_g1_i2.p1 TRINITY_DN2123_c0_g1~~TRINITY_DN2123_c0_g1_i2.p1  ORF type:complete len:613 (-),score=116.61 TRINITY_DN2123_c0_g1_i2:155-1993(-)
MKIVPSKINNLIEHITSKMDWRIIASALAFPLLLFLLKKKKVAPQKREGEYDIEELKAPRSTGFNLSLMCWLLENPPFSWILIPALYQKNNFGILRKLRLNREPINIPRIPAQHSIFEGDTVNEYAYALSPQREMIGRFLTVSDYAHAYRNSQITPEEVAKLALDCIMDSDTESPPLRAFISIHREDVIQQAKESTERFRNGKPLSILDGVLVAVKDEVYQKGHKTTVGSSFIGEVLGVATYDATVVERLRAQGAILIGKTNMHEFGLSTLGYNTHFGHPRNPYNTSHYTGGSSSGSACAVAAGLVPLAVGADGGGSIRVPAALCGVVGLKPTHSRCSEHGAFPLCWSVAHLGPIGATVKDVAIGYSVMAGTDPSDPGTFSQPPVVLPDLDNVKLSLKGLRVGVYTPWFNHASKEVVDSCRLMLNQMEDLGAEIKEISIPNLEIARLSHATAILTEMATNLEQYREKYLKSMGTDVRVSLAFARQIPSIDYIQANRVRGTMVDKLKEIFEEVDVIATPTVASTAPPLKPDAESNGESNFPVVGRLMRYAFLANLTGIPGITFPVGYSNESGLPIGFQLMAKWWNEALLLNVANICEKSLNIRKLPHRFHKIL